MSIPARSGRSENPYRPPTADDSPPAPAEGQTVTIAAADRLPKICLRCGVKKGTKRRTIRMHWFPPVAYLALPLGVFPYLLLISLIQRTAIAQLPFCDPCHGVWVNTGLVRGGMIIAGAVSVIVVLTVGLGGAPLVGAALALASAAGITLAWRRFLPPDRLRVQRIDPGGIVVFAGVNGAARDAIEAMYEEEDE
ncbi:MAG: hypothetical protein QM820_44120 [Minicystis sp.]